MIGLVAIYEPGHPLADELHALWPDSSRVHRASRGSIFQAPEAMGLAFGLHHQVIAVGSLATVVHLLADVHPALRRDTDVLCVDPQRRWVIPLTHGDSTEELTREVEA
ncbi:hypothetical protein J0670_30645, partial [Streptomyces sp. FH025]|nr:hypothetical protein [Streptomyces sp. FH025]